MPFVYYGGKKGSAHRYPPPAFGTIIEPFAGSAGYALAWAKPSTRVILVEKDPEVVRVWRRLQAPDAEAMLRAIPDVAKGDPFPDPIVALSTVTAGAIRKRTVTSRVEVGWPSDRRRLITALPTIRDWSVIEGDYTDAPDERATWFIDPPYAPRADGRRPGTYHHGDTIDYEALAAWCRERRGQVIVCEQEGADWLPFRPLFVQKSGLAGTDGEHPPRVEVVWTRTPGIVQHGTPRHREAEAARRVRRAARRAR